MSSEGPGEAHLAITLSDEQDLKVDPRRLVQVARRTAASEGATGEISITLVREDRMRELNEAYLGEPHSTDVLAFPIDDVPVQGAQLADRGGPGRARRGDSPDLPPRMIGEVVICPEVAEQQAEGGVESELDLLVAHGVLHLLGYDHDTEDHAARMRLREHDLTGRWGARA